MSSTTTKTCSTCKHTLEPHDFFNGYGVCEKCYTLNDKENDATNTARILIVTYIDCKDVTEIEFQVPRNFGCIHWESNVPTPRVTPEEHLLKALKGCSARQDSHYDTLPVRDRWEGGLLETIEEAVEAKVYDLELQLDEYKHQYNNLKEAIALLTNCETITIRLTADEIINHLKELSIDPGFYVYKYHPSREEEPHSA